MLFASDAKRAAKSQVEMTTRDKGYENTHGIVGGEEVDEFSDGEGDGHGDRRRYKEETYGEEERLFLGFCECDDFAKGRAGAGRGSECLGE